MLSFKLLFSCCSSSVLPLSVLLVLSAITLTIGDFPAFSNPFMSHSKFFSFSPPSKYQAASCYFVFSHPSCWLCSYFAQCLCFQQALTVWAQWYSLFLLSSLQLYAFKSEPLQKPGWEPGSAAYAWKVLPSTFPWLFQPLLQKFSASASLAWQHHVKLSNPI